MTERERLIDLLNESLTESIGLSSILSASIADYLLTHGVTVLSCKIDDKVYSYCEERKRVLGYSVYDISIMQDDDRGELRLYYANCVEGLELLGNIEFDDDDVGDTVFLTREEAKRNTRKFTSIHDKES